MTHILKKLKEYNMSFKRYENQSLQRIEILLEKLLAHFEKENNPEFINDISKNLKKLNEEKDEIKGGDFL